VHRQARAVAAAVREIEQRTGREARDVEVAEHMGLTLEDYHRALQDAAVCQLASLEDKAGDEFSDDADPFQDAADDQFRSALGSAIGNLPERERMVMSLYYSDGLNLKEIGAVLEVTESRVCQLHGQALTRLRARLTDWRKAVQEAKS
jgi:RNA polymerase sigma factor for flagellar operon FliA